MQNRQPTVTTTDEAKPTTPKKPAILSANFYSAPPIMQYWSTLRAMTADTVVDQANALKWHLPTNKLDVEAFKMGPFCHLPHDRFARVVTKPQCKLEIYCSNTNALLKEIELLPGPFPEWSQFQLKNSLSPDGKMLMIQLEYDEPDASTPSGERPSLLHQHCYELFMDTQTYDVIRRPGQDNRRITWLGNHQYITLDYDDGQRASIHSLQCDDVIPFEMDKDTRRIYAWPQHPDFWIAAIDDEATPVGYSLYVYHVKRTAESYVVTKGKRCGDIYYGNLDITTGLLANSLVYVRDNTHKTLVELDLTQFENQPMEFAGYTEVRQRCIFPDGKVGFSARDKNKKHCFITAKLASVRECADKEEAALVEVLDDALTAPGRPHVTRPLRRMIAGYASAFFAVEKEVVVEEGVDEVSEKTVKCG